MELHSTDLRTFQNCRVAWWFSSPLSQGYRPNVPSPEVFTGSLFHKGVEAWAQEFSKSISLDQATAAGLIAIEAAGNRQLEDPNFRRTISVLPGATGEKFAEAIDMAHALFENFTMWAPGRWEIIETEQKFRVNIPSLKNRPTRGWLAGKVDSLVRYRDKLWVIDFKTSSPSAKGVAPEYVTDIQTNAYVWAMWRLGYKVEGALRVMCYKVLPREPEPVLSGERLSRKKITTTYEHVMSAIRRYQYNPNDYSDWLAELEVAPHPAFQILEYPKTQADLKFFGRRLYHLYREVAGKVIYPNEGRHCRFCWYKDPCLALVQRLDYGYLLEEFFHKNAGPVEETEGE